MEVRQGAHVGSESHDWVYLLSIIGHVLFQSGCYRRSQENLGNYNSCNECLIL